MRAKPREYGIGRLIVAIALAWVAGAAAVGIAVAAGLGALVIAGGAAAVALVAVGVGALLGRRDRAARAAAEERARQAEAELAEIAAAEARARFDAIEQSVQGLLVEIVAARQGVVRAAYPDDILIRLAAAEDAGQELLGALETAVMAAPALSPVPAPRAAAGDSSLPAELTRTAR